MNKKKGFVLLCFLAGLITGCSVKKEEPLQAVQPVVEETKTTEVKTEKNVLDFKRAIQTAVKNMLQSGALDNPAGERYVVAVSSIFDFTKKGFDTKDIKQRLGETLAAGRKVRVVSVSSKSVAPQIIISGRITQRTAYVRGGKKRQEYYLQLILTEAKSGMKLWENTTPVVKRENRKPAVKKENQKPAAKKDN